MSWESCTFAVENKQRLNNTTMEKNNVGYEPVIEKCGRGFFGYVLTVGNKVSRLISESCDHPGRVVEYKTYVARGARAFKKTAGVLVYQKHKLDNEVVWLQVDSCEVSRYCNFDKTMSDQEFRKLIKNEM